MSDLATHIQATPLADTHEHTGTEDAFVNDGPDVLQSLFTAGYITADLVVAGAARQAVEALEDKNQGDVAARFAAVQQAWQHCQHTGYGEGVRLSAKLVYGIDEITPESLAAAAGQNAELQRPGGRRRIFEELANVEYVHLDYGTWACPVDSAGPDFFFKDLSWTDFANAQFDVQAVHKELGVETRGLSSLREAVAAIFAKHGPTAIAVKTAHAYDRTLQWRERTDAEVVPVLHKRLRGQDLNEDERLCLGDWCLARGVELATEHNLPIKIHTGYYASHSCMPLERTRPAHLCPLLIKYPKARFDLFHTGYPYGGEICALAKHFPNVYADLCWAWSIDPASTMDFVRRAIHAVPINKLFVFGGDAAWPTQTVGYAAQCRQWLTRALAAEVNEGLLTERQAMDIATRVMRLNQAECFDTTKTRSH